jgi:hypothetical protein
MDAVALATKLPRMRRDEKACAESASDGQRYAAANKFRFEA